MRYFIQDREGIYRLALFMDTLDKFGLMHDVEKVEVYDASAREAVWVWRELL